MQGFPATQGLGMLQLFAEMGVYWLLPESSWLSSLKKFMMIIIIVEIMRDRMLLPIVPLGSYNKINYN